MDSVIRTKCHNVLCFEDFNSNPCMMKYSILIDSQSSNPSSKRRAPVLIITLHCFNIGFLGKNDDLVPQSNIYALGHWKYNFFTQKDVEMPHLKLNNTKLSNIGSFTIVCTLNEIETNICRSAISEKSLIKHTEINFESILFITYVKEMPNLHTHTHNTHSLVVHLGL